MMNVWNIRTGKQVKLDIAHLVRKPLMW